MILMAVFKSCNSWRTVSDAKEIEALILRMEQASPTTVLNWAWQHTGPRNWEKNDKIRSKKFGMAGYCSMMSCHRLLWIDITQRILQGIQSNVLNAPIIAGKVGVDINESQHLSPAVPSPWDARWAWALSFFRRMNRDQKNVSIILLETCEIIPANQTYFSQNRGRMTNTSLPITT